MKLKIIKTWNNPRELEESKEYKEIFKGYHVPSVLNDYDLKFEKAVILENNKLYIIYNSDIMTITEVKKDACINDYDLTMVLVKDNTIEFTDINISKSNRQFMQKMKTFDKQFCFT